MKNKKHLRLGRVYHIKPDPIPPHDSKEREAVYVGHIISFGSRMNVFIQMGSSKYYDDYLNEFNKKVEYFWKEIDRDGYFHIATSKPEYNRVIKNVYKHKGKFIEMRKKDAMDLMAIWKSRIINLEKYRWKRAHAYYVLNNEKESLKQMNLLKYTMPWKYKQLKPTKQIKKWKNKDNK